MGADPVRVGESLLDELQAGTPVLRPHAASMTQVAKVSYTHDAMIDMLVAEPALSQGTLAARFGYSPAWICHIIASDAFQMRLAERKDALVDPALRASIEERFKALVLRSLQVLEEKLARPDPPDNLALRAAELGARSLGLGRAEPPAPPPSGDRLVILANRLVVLQDNVRKGASSGQTINGEARRIDSSSPQEVLRQEPHAGEPAEAAVSADRGLSDSAAQTDGGSGLVGGL